MNYFPSSTWHGPIHRRTTYIGIWVCLTFLLIFSNAVFASPFFIFTRIDGADPNQTPWDSQAGGLNDAGIVAFTRRYSNGITEAYRGDGSTSVLIAKTGDTAPDGRLFSGVGATDINNSNVVSLEARFTGAPGNSGTGIFTSNGISITQIHLALSTGQIGSGSGSTDINNNSKLTYVDPDNIFAGPPSTIVAASGVGVYADFGAFPGINDSGTIAFYADLKSGLLEIRTIASPYSSATTTIIESGTGGEHFGQVTRMSNSGFVLYAEVGTNGIQSLYVDNGPSRTLIADTTGTTIPYNSFNFLDINDFNDVVFEAALRFPYGGGNHGIYFGGLDGTIIPVIEPGEMLFGQQVATTYSPNINNACQVSFTALIFQPGPFGGSLRQEAYRADPLFPCGMSQVPEPATFLLVIAGLGAMVLRKRLRRNNVPAR